jgi:hypothetical protein
VSESGSNRLMGKVGVLSSSERAGRFRARRRGKVKTGDEEVNGEREY